MTNDAPANGWKRYWGFSRTPFAKQLAASELYAHPGHLEAVARVRWAIDENTIALVTGEVGAGKTVAVRAAVDALDHAAHTIIYVGNAGIGARGIHQHIALGGPEGDGQGSITVHESSQRGMNVIEGEEVLC